MTTKVVQHLAQPLQPVVLVQALLVAFGIGGAQQTAGKLNPEQAQLTVDWQGEPFGQF
jgi:hypothetical protein